jgi:prepilin-type N-terminal cleavage/methylation domain-containing protein
MKLKQVLKKIHNSSPPPQGGYTILESLVAMVVVAVLMSAVAPIIVFSVGTRVQARRIELGAQAARSYIDAVRTQQLDPPQGFFSEDDITANPLTECSQVDATNKLQYCTSEVVAATAGQFYCVDNDGDGKCTPNSMTDMMVWASIILADDVSSDYRNEMITANSKSDKDEGAKTKRELGYQLSVKVYRASAFTSSVKLLYSDNVASAVNNAGLSSRYTSGGEEVERPLYKGTADISPTDNSFQNYRDRLQ